MITFDQLRTALLADDPHGTLDRLIRVELSAGRTTKAVYDELVGFIETLRTMPGYTDEMEDPLGDKLDGLSGWCHPDDAYTDSATPGPISPVDVTNGHSTTRPKHISRS